VSEWGHEFRENYRELSLLKEQFPNISIAAFTATATNSVERDIVNQLKLDNPLRVRGSLFRSNLTIKAQHRIKDGRLQLLEFLKRHRGDAGIIYTLSRKSTENIAHFLQTKGIDAKPYHAGMPTEEKNSTYADFVSDRISIVVATIAFGMGIDKSNIRFVVHMSMPKPLENFYQEIGRAGRDGLEAETLLLFSAQDIVQQRFFIDNLPDTPYRQHVYNKLDNIVRFANGEECRHQVIAKYFGDNIDRCMDKCDNCLEPDIKRIDITTASRKLLSAIYRTGQNFGLHYVVDVLRGSKEKRIIENHHDKLSVYGIGDEYSKTQWLTIADRLLELGAVEIGEFKVYRLSTFGVEIIKGDREVELREDRLTIKKSIIKKIADSFLDDCDIEIFEKLKSLRREIAQANNIPPYIVFSDKTLKELTIKLPKSKADMLMVHGIGEVKFERYGEKFLSLIEQIVQ
jgi:ATP-dependent DNA helicase RecQ